MTHSKTKSSAFSGKGIRQKKKQKKKILEIKLMTRVIDEYYLDRFYIESDGKSVFSRFEKIKGLEYR